MNREILFHGKRIDNGEWVEGSLVVWSDGSMSIFDPRLDVPTFAVDPATVGQYTGLTDKNGKRIFEGDVVRMKTTAYFFEWLYVRWHERTAQFVTTNRFGLTSYPMSSSFEYEVIGNVVDNPELLGGGSDG